MITQVGGFRAKKRLGQHFLMDDTVVDRIVRCVDIGPDDTVLEIGPGLGALTVPLGLRANRLLAVEKDRHAATLLRERLVEEGIMGATVIDDDILRCDVRTLVGPTGRKILVVGNLPYNISKPVLRRLVGYRDLVKRAVLMFQTEVADRLEALPGTKDYGAMTVLVRYYAEVTRVMKVPPGAFRPRPKVSSTVLTLDFERPYPRVAADEGWFETVVRGSFSHRRKTLVNSLRGAFPGWTRESILRALTTCGVDPSRRAETLSMDEFLAMASAFRERST